MLSVVAPTQHNSIVMLCSESQFNQDQRCFDTQHNDNMLRISIQLITPSGVQVNAVMASVVAVDAFIIFNTLLCPAFAKKYARL